MLLSSVLSRPFVALGCLPTYTSKGSERRLVACATKPQRGRRSDSRRVVNRTPKRVIPGHLTKSRLPLHGATHEESSTARACHVGGCAEKAKKVATLTHKARLTAPPGPPPASNTSAPKKLPITSWKGLVLGTCVGARGNVQTLRCGGNEATPSRAGQLCYNAGYRPSSIHQTI